MVAIFILLFVVAASDAGLCVLQMVASMTKQPVKAVGEVAPPDASESAPKPLPAKATSVEDVVTERPSPGAAVRRVAEPRPRAVLLESRPRAVSPDVDEPVVEAKHLVNKTPSSEVPRRRVELATPQVCTIVSLFMLCEEVMQFCLLWPLNCATLENSFCPFFSQPAKLNV